MHKNISKKGNKVKKNFKIEELIDVELSEPKANSNVSMPAYKGEPKGFVIDYVIAGCAVILIPVALGLGFTLEKYKIIGILIAVMSAMGAFSMFTHIELCRKIVKLVTIDERLTITALMVETKKKNRDEFIKAVKGAIKDKHLAYYQLEDNEKLVKVEKTPEEGASEVKIVEVVLKEYEKEETTDENTNN